MNLFTKSLILILLLNTIFAQEKILDRNIASLNETSGIASIGNKVIFLAYDSTNGQEPWVSDGTSNGTTLLKDINPGASSSTGYGGTFGYYPAPNNGKAILFLDDGVHGIEPWVTDGTSTGTTLLADLNPGLADSRPTSFTKFGNHIYFIATPYPSPNDLDGKLFRTDGSEVTSVAGVLGETIGESLKVIGNNLFYLIKQTGGDLVLVKFDGTTTTLLHNFGNIGTDVSGKHDLQNLNENLIILFRNQIWKFNTTENTTTLVKEICPTYDTTFGTGCYIDGTGNHEAIKNTLVVNNKLYFAASTPTTGTELWVSDGTTSGTNLLREFTAIGSTNLLRFTPFKDGFLLGAYIEGGTGTLLFYYNASNSTFTNLGNINGSGSETTSMIAVSTSGYAYFSSSSLTTGAELHKTDGTVSGTTMVADLNTVPLTCPGESETAGSTAPRAFFSKNGVLYFMSAIYDCTDIKSDLYKLTDDLCPEDTAKTAPGVCGCGISDTDTVADGVYDCNVLSYYKNQLALLRSSVSKFSFLTGKSGKKRMIANEKKIKKSVLFLRNFYNANKAFINTTVSSANYLKLWNNVYTTKMSFSSKKSLNASKLKLLKKMSLLKIS